MPIDDELGGQLVIDLTRVVKLLRAVNLAVPRFHEELEPSAHPLLFTLCDGSARVTELAERVHTDASVVSRQIGHLRSLGLVTKVSDPDDGRATLVTLTASGRDLVSEILAGRGRWMADVLTDWSPGQAESLHRNLEHLAASLNATLTDLTTTEETR